MTDHVIIDAGTLEFSEADLAASGLLVPYGVKARSNVGEFEVGPGVFEIPEDTTGATHNLDHKRENPVAAITRLWEQPEGLFASYKYANTPAGRAAYEEGKSGKRKHLSVEAAGVLIRGGKAIAGRVFGSAQVEKPAFAGATLLAAEDTTVLDPAAETVPDPAHLAIDVEALPADITVTTPAGDSAVYAPEAEAPAEENPTEGGSTVTATEAPAGAPATATVPTTLLASASNVEAVTKAYELGTIFANMAMVKSGADASAADAETLLAALADIKTSGAGALPAAGVLQPEWVGRVWQGRSYAQKFIDLGTRGYGIKAGGRKGFKLDQGTALVQPWAGNKAEIGSGTATTEVLSSTLRKYGFAADIAREFYDLEGGADVIEAFVQGVVDSYAKITDIDALADLLTAGVANGINAAGTDYPTEYPEAMGILIDAIDAVDDAEDEPTFALVNPAAWRQLRFTPKDLVPEYVSFTVATGGTGTADGKVIVRKAPAASFAAAGFDNTAPAVVAGAKRAIEFREQGTTPIRLDALDIARGGVDKAVIGYLETFVQREESFVAFGTEAI